MSNFSYIIEMAEYRESVEKSVMALSSAAITSQDSVNGSLGTITVNRASG